MFDVTLQRIRPAVEDQVFGQLVFLGRDLGIGCDLRRVDDGHIQAGLYAVIEHDRIQHRAGLRRQAEGQIAYAQRGHHAGRFCFDQPDAFDGLDGRIGKFGIAGGQREGQGIEDQVFRAQAVVVDGNIVNAFGNFQFACARFLPCRSRRWSAR